MDHYSSLIAVSLIISGSVIMLLNIIRFRKTLGVFNSFDLVRKRHLRLFGQLHRGLMVFFLIGYIAVAYAILSNVDLVSELFVGLIFALGAVFVWLGIMLQHYMLALIQSRYKQASKARAELEIERERLESTNDQLTAEIGERRRAETALRESEQRLKFILDQIPSGILVVDESSMIIKSANPAALNLLGLPLVEVIGSPYGQVVHPPQGEFSPADDSDLKADAFRRRVIVARGEEIPILTTYCRIRLDGRPHLIESLIDISEKERLEAELQRAQKMEALGTLAGGVAHDLNNILSGIVSYPELMLRDLPPDSPMYRPIQTIHKSGEKATTIVQDMLTLARRGVVMKAAVNLANVVRDYLESPEHGRLMAYHPQVDIECQVENDLLNVMGSSIHLTKTVMNLVSNAAEAMPEGGTVNIKLENRYVDRPLAGYDTVEEGDYAVLTISDTGVGIPQEDRDRVFEPFFTKKEVGRSGTGLGMAVVWGTVKDHQGYVHVDSMHSRGTSITLYIPATRKKVDPATESESVDGYNGNGETILIVDDVGLQRDIAADMLSSLNYTIHAVPSGEAAVAYLRQQSVDLILLDMIMDPGMGGLRTYQEVLKVHPKQRALLVSGYAKTDDVRKAQQLGAGNYLKKPYKLVDLAKAVMVELKG